MSAGPSMLEVVDGIVAALGRGMSSDEIDLLHRLVAGTDYGKSADWYVGRVLDAIGDKIAVPDDELRVVSYVDAGRGKVRAVGRGSRE